MKRYLVQLAHNTWLTSATGTTDVTTDIKQARRFQTRWLATRAMGQALQSQSYPDARITPVVHGGAARPDALASGQRNQARPHLGWQSSPGKSVSLSQHKTWYPLDWAKTLLSRR